MFLFVNILKVIFVITCAYSKSAANDIWGHIDSVMIVQSCITKLRNYIMLINMKAGPWVTGTYQISKYLAIGVGEINERKTVAFF